MHYDMILALLWILLRSQHFRIDVSTGTASVFTTFALYRIGLANRI